MSSRWSSSSSSSSVPMLLRSFINGKYWDASSSSSSNVNTGSSSSCYNNTNTNTNYELHSAVTGQLRATVEAATAQACEAALAAAHARQPQWHRDYSPMERSQLLLRAADLFLQDSTSSSRQKAYQHHHHHHPHFAQQQEEESNNNNNNKKTTVTTTTIRSIAQLETDDTGRPLSETQWEASAAADCLQWYAGLTRSVGGQYLELPSTRANDRQRISHSSSSFSNNWGYTRREPLGVTVGIGAWNYPLQSVIWKSAPSLAFGNTMVFKPSEFTPQTALRTAEIYQHVGIPDGVFNVVLGTGPTVGQQLIQDPRVAKISFTGSVSTGRHIYRTAAEEDFKKVTLELGGKSPLIIWDDANLDAAVSAAMMANWLSTGQVCSNGTRVFVHRTILPAFIEQLLERTSQLKLGDPMDPNTQIGPLIHEEHRKKVQEYIRIGIEDDQAELLYGGRRILTDEFPHGNFLEPTIFLCHHDEMRIVQEEIFGPVLAILPFDTEDEVIQRANHTKMGLAAGVFTKDLQRAHRMVGRLEAGTTWINNYNVAPPELPWGGFGHSGMGSENGLAGVESWTRLKSVYVEMEEMESPY